MLNFLSNAENTRAYRQCKGMCHMINKRFTQKLTLSCFCYSCILLLLHTKLLEFTQLIMMDVLHHHNIMVNVLHIQSVFWCTDINPFNVSHLKIVFWHADPILSFTNQAKHLSLHVVSNTIFSVFRSIMWKWHGFTFVNINHLWIFWCWHWHDCIYNGGFGWLMSQ